MSNEKRIAMRVSDELHEELKTYTFLRKITITEYLTELLKKDENLRKELINKKIK